LGSSALLLAVAACTGSPAGNAPAPSNTTGGTATVVGMAGSAGSMSMTGPVSQTAPPYQPAPGALRRLTRTQFRNAVRDVFGLDVDTNELDSDNYTGNFAVVGASSVVTSERGVEQYQTAIEGAVAGVFGDAAKRAAFVGCTPSGSAGDACVRGFIQTLGLRAWRRPLESAEVDRLAAIATTAATQLGSPFEGARWATVALFTSPHFLYRPELGTAAADGALRFTAYEQASRLAFLIWNSLPDAALLEQAANGALGTAAGLRSAAARLLGTPAGREAVGAFAEEYLRLDRIATQAKDPQFAEYTAALQTAMARDMRGTWEVLAFDDKASALELFSTFKVVVNADLAKLYGLDATGLTATTFEVRSLPANGPRRGILSKAAFLSAFANQKEGSPTLRGKFMREAFLCGSVPPPPGDVALMLVEPPADMPLTKRQRLEIHRTAPTCNACHGLMDPLGLPLESFDAIGRYRTVDHGLPIDPSGDFDGKPVTDSSSLGAAVGANASVAQCLVRKYYSYAVGHEQRDVDASVLNALVSSFTASGFALQDLVLDVVSNDAFSSVAPQL
jgi:hypothetical protein